MRVEEQFSLTLSVEEMEAMVECCFIGLEHDLLDGMPKAFALAIVESWNEVADEAGEPQQQEMLQ